MSASNLMLIPDEQLDAEIHDLKCHISALEGHISNDRHSDDGRTLQWFKAKLAELVAEKNRRLRTQAQRATSALTSPQKAQSSSARHPPSKKHSGHEFEGPPIIVVEQGVPRLWRPGDRIHKKRP